MTTSPGERDHGNNNVIVVRLTVVQARKQYAQEERLTGRWSLK